jgi:hypothetical protein
VEERYAKASEIWSSEFRAAHNRQMIRPVLEFQLVLDEHDAGAPWEAALAFNSETMQKFAETQLLIRRRLRMQEAVRAEPVTGTLRVFSWAIDAVSEDVARIGWREDTPADASAVPAQAMQVKFEPSSSGGSEPEVSVLHLFGSAVALNDGVKLRLGHDAVKVTHAEQEKRLSGLMLRAEEIAARFPNLHLCIVQGIPESVATRATGRAEAALMRRFAAAIFRCGVPAVVVLPPLPQNLAEESVRALAAHLRALAVATRRQKRRPGGTKPWLQVVRQIQELIARDPRWPDTDEGREMALEIPFDVCLYMTDDFDLAILPGRDRRHTPSA